MTPILSVSRPTLATNGVLNSLHALQRRLAHNGTAASRTVAALAASSPPSSSSALEPKTHFRITLRRSGISLGKRIQGTLAALGLRRRMQTVYHPHTQEAAGMILAVKELVEVQNVPSSAVRTAGQQRAERKALRGFTVVGSKMGPGMTSSDVPSSQGPLSFNHRPKTRSQMLRTPGSDSRFILEGRTDQLDNNFAEGYRGLLLCGG